MDKSVIYIDMDGVVADYDGGVCKIFKNYHDVDNVPSLQHELKMFAQESDGFWERLSMVEGSQSSVAELLAREFIDKDVEVYFLSRAPWASESAWTGKRRWLETFLKSCWNFMYKILDMSDEQLKDIKVCEKKERLILCPDKSLLRGDYLIDDGEKHGQPDFQGEWIHFGSSEFPNWNITIEYIINSINKK